MSAISARNPKSCQSRIHLNCRHRRWWRSARVLSGCFAGHPHKVGPINQRPHCGRSANRYPDCVQLLKTFPWWLTGLFLYLWSVPLLIAALWIFDLRFEYDGDLLFWIVAAYIMPVGAIKEMSGVAFGTSLSIYLAILTLATVWLVRSKRSTYQLV